MPATLRFSRLRFFAGPSPAEPPLEIKPSTVVVLIGPNNSGKSLALREIETWCTSGDRERKVIDSISVDFPADIDSATELLASFTVESSVDKVQTNDQVSYDLNFILHHPAVQ